LKNFQTKILENHIFKALTFNDFVIFRNHAFSRRTSSVLVYFPHHHPLTLYMIFHPIFGRTSTLAFSVSDFPFYAAEIQKRRAWIARQGKRHQTPKQIPDINKANTMRRILNIRRKRAGPVPGPTYKRHHNPANNGDAEMRKKNTTSGPSKSLFM